MIIIVYRISMNLTCALNKKAKTAREEIDRNS